MISSRFLSFLNKKWYGRHIFNISFCHRPSKLKICSSSCNCNKYKDKLQKQPHTFIFSSETVCRSAWSILREMWFSRLLFKIDVWNFWWIFVKSTSFYYYFVLWSVGYSLGIYGRTNDEANFNQASEAFRCNHPCVFFPR